MAHESFENSVCHSDLSIVIPSFNQKQLLRRCLESVARFAPVGAETIVVDDASTDGTTEMLGCEFPWVRVIRNAHNRGFCASANIGWREARSSVIELLNNDTLVTADWAVPALECLRDPSVGAVAPLVRQLPFRGRIDSAGDDFLPFGMARKRLEGRRWRTRQLHRQEVFSASASSAFYRRQALVEAGGFPELYGAYFDDVELGARIRARGFRCIFEPQSVVYHWVGQSHRVRSRRMQQQLAVNSERLFWRNRSLAHRLMFAGPHIAFVLALLAHRGLKGEFGSWFAGKCQGLVEVSQSIGKSALHRAGAISRRMPSSARLSSGMR